MSRYMLDTTVLIEVEKGIEPTSSRVIELLSDHHELCICPVQLAEFYSGILLGENPRMDAFLERLTFIPLWHESSVNAGWFRFNAALLGRRLATPDALIASATVLATATLLTNNPNDFNLPGLRVEALGGAGESVG